ncbi:uncharacterized protein L969DRAFT_79738 [Mixia osmundae IAM 14324]|uniref:C2 domain-containing protein n=1 Tax=Mixia osmundae (strain CBS 9802 / IAM 14324 / JCM 22182 / KY 12970) TaxID=764103 RepID=G7E1R7_MIXOS|nr:uncharacterized protein L969DRAFT_79738 [Mixia osmundae IAM 14324]KEI36726.1 hypothetical protein L969DRAFT_79738 [Mixia osmundae IAM 14324]GAA96777.1 hypothetical protein E5Q_03448 [Mixia osmundae IAM 14324]
MSDESKAEEPYGDHKKVAQAQPKQRLVDDAKDREDRVRRDDGSKSDSRRTKGPHKVFDPVTQEDVTVEDASRSDLRLQERYITEQGPVAHSADLKSLFTALPDKSRTNLLYYEHPPADWDRLLLKIRNFLLRYVSVLALATVIYTHFASSRIATTLFLGFVGASGFVAFTRITSSYHDTVWSTEKVRGKAAQESKVPESTEWLNNLVSGVWPIIDPVIFESMSDVLEDILQANVPGIINSVKLVEMSQGTTPIRILSMKPLPDKDLEEITSRQHREDQDEDAQVGAFSNLEVVFCYRAIHDDSSLEAKLRNIRIALQFFVGAKKLVSIPLPIWIEVLGIVGRMRIRIQTVSQAPFVRNVTITLMGLPRVEISAIPMSTYLPNVMNLPLISHYVASCIDAAMGQYVAPKSLTLDIGEMITGDGIKKKLETFGVLIVNINWAKDLPKSDTFGSSDSYVAVEYSKIAKPIYSTRICADDTQPVWHEVAVIPISSAAVKAAERIKLTCYDSDRFSPDDPLGTITINLDYLMRHRGKVQHHEDKLNTPDGKPSNDCGTLCFDVGYYGLRPLDFGRQGTGQDPRIPQELIEKEQALQEEQAETLKKPPILRTPPDPEYLAGLLSVTVVSIVGLHHKASVGRETRRSMKPYEKGTQDEETESQDPAADGASAPSAYCKIAINDELVYKTRNKPYASHPVFNAGCERFIPSWKEGLVQIAVRDSKDREADALLGVVVIRLRDAFENASCSQKFYPIEGGTGSGRMCVGLLFRSVDVKLPRTFAGWNVGTVRLLSDLKVVEPSEGYSLRDFSDVALRLTTASSRKAISKRKSTSSEDAISWSTAVEDPPYRLPIKRRNATALAIEFRKRGSSLRLRSFAIATLWLHQLEDNTETVVRLPIWKTTHIKRVMSSIIEGEKSNVQVEQIAILTFRVSFKSGLGDVHHFSKSAEDVDMMEAWEAAVSEGLRKRKGDFYDHGQNQQPDVSIQSHDKVAKIDDTTVSDRAMGQLPSANGYEDESAGENDSEEEEVSDHGEDETDVQKQRKTQHEGKYKHKVIRSADWMAQSVKTSSHQLKHAFSLHAKEPDVETEI